MAALGRQFRGTSERLKVAVNGLSESQSGSFEGVIMGAELGAQRAELSAHENGNLQLKPFRLVMPACADSFHCGHDRLGDCAPVEPEPVAVHRHHLLHPRAQ